MLVDQARSLQWRAGRPRCPQPVGAPSPPAHRSRPVWASPRARARDARSTPKDPRGIPLANPRLERHCSAHVSSAGNRNAAVNRCLPTAGELPSARRPVSWVRVSPRPVRVGGGSGTVRWAAYRPPLPLRGEGRGTRRSMHGARRHFRPLGSHWWCLPGPRPRCHSRRSQERTRQKDPCARAAANT